MIIKAKPISPLFYKPIALIFWLLFIRRFNKSIINEVTIKPGHSYILMCNHFSFFDGVFLSYLMKKVIMKKVGIKRIYIMSLKKQMQKNKWLRYSCHES